MSDETSALLAELAEQEERLVFTGFDNDDAWRLGCLLVDMARQRRLPVTVDIRCNGHQLFHAALPGTAPTHDLWIERKARVVEHLRCSSYLAGRRLAAAGEELDHTHGVDPARYATHGGAFPVRVRGVGVIGAVVVSGLPQADDHRLVVEAIEAYLAGDRSPEM
jgi:uncharacterized protein (UPF0303 family)